MPPVLRSWTDAGDLLCIFQAEDGIRDFHVTGVQPCALPILRHRRMRFAHATRKTWCARSLPWRTLRRKTIWRPGESFSQSGARNNSLPFLSAFVEKCCLHPRCWKIPAHTGNRRGSKRKAPRRARRSLEPSERGSPEASSETTGRGRKTTGGNTQSVFTAAHQLAILWRPKTC